MSYRFSGCLNNMHLVLATANRHKCIELAAMLPNWTVSPYADYFGHPHTCVEDGDTFEANAIQKIKACPPDDAVYLLADDSGLVVDALGGAPGVHSARYGGDGLTDQDRCHLLLAALGDTDHRTARFVCAMALRHPNGSLLTRQGTLHGHIARSLAGTHGFGYDPVFIPEGYDTTLAMVDMALKNTISHRHLALTAMIRDGL